MDNGNGYLLVLQVPFSLMGKDELFNKVLRKTAWPLVKISLHIYKN